MAYSKFDQIKMNNAVYDALFNISKNKIDNLVEVPSKNERDINRQIRECQYMLNYGKNLTEDDRIYFKNTIEYLENLKLPTYVLPFRSEFKVPYNKFVTWTSALRFISLFYNDGHVNLIKKDALKNAIDGKFYTYSTNKIDEFDKMLKNIDYTLTYDKLKDLRKVLKAHSEGKRLNPTVYKNLSEIVEFKDSQIIPYNSDYKFLLTDDGALKCIFKDSYGAKVCALMQDFNKDEDKFKLFLESKPLKAVKLIKPQSYKFVNGKKEIIPAKFVEYTPDEVFDLFRNASAHSAKQVYNEKTLNYMYKNQVTGDTIVYDYGWLQGFTTFFVNEDYNRLYGQNSEYDARPGWRKDEQRRELVIPNNEFIIVANPKKLNKFEKFLDFRQYLKDRKYYKLTINDDVSMGKAQEIINKVNDRLFWEGGENSKYNSNVILAYLNKYKIKNYQLEEVRPEKNQQIESYWKCRLKGLEEFYSLELQNQLALVDEIEQVNKHKMYELTSYGNRKYNSHLAKNFLEVLETSIITDNSDSWEKDNFELTSHSIGKLQLLNQELPVFIASMKIYTSLIESGYSDNICAIENDEFVKCNKKDEEELNNLDLSGFKMVRKNGDNKITIEGANCTLQDKKHFIRHLRNAVAHGKVEAVNHLRYYDNPDDIEIAFKTRSNKSKRSSLKVVTTVGDIMQTFGKPIFLSPTHTEIRGLNNYKYKD